MNGVTMRLRKVINWLIFNDIADSEKALADLLGYTKSSFSQIVNGKVPLSEKFLTALCSLDENINKVWVKTGEGNFLANDINISQTVESNSGSITHNVGTKEVSSNNTTNTTNNNTTNNYAECEKANTSSKLLGMAIEEISEQRKLVSKAQQQIDRLITLLENK